MAIVKRENKKKRKTIARKESLKKKNELTENIAKILAAQYFAGLTDGHKGKYKEYLGDIKKYYAASLIEWIAASRGVISLIRKE